jgi:hypothetical protein
MYPQKKDKDEFFAHSTNNLACRDGGQSTPVFKAYVMNQMSLMPSSYEEKLRIMRQLIPRP